MRHGFRYGIEIDGNGASGNKVEGNYIGTDVSGEQNLGNSVDDLSLPTALTTRRAKAYGGKVRTPRHTRRWLWEIR